MSPAAGTSRLATSSCFLLSGGGRLSSDRQFRQCSRGFCTPSGETFGPNFRSLTQKRRRNRTTKLPQNHDTGIVYCTNNGMLPSASVAFMFIRQLAPTSEVPGECDCRFIV